MMVALPNVGADGISRTRKNPWQEVTDSQPLGQSGEGGQEGAQDKSRRKNIGQGRQADSIGKMAPQNNKQCGPQQIDRVQQTQLRKHQATEQKLGNYSSQQRCWNNQQRGQSQAIPSNQQTGNCGKQPENSRQPFIPETWKGVGMNRQKKRPAHQQGEQAETNRSS